MWQQGRHNERHFTADIRKVQNFINGLGFRQRERRRKANCPRTLPLICFFVSSTLSVGTVRDDRLALSSLGKARVRWTQRRIISASFPSLLNVPGPARMGGNIYQPSEGEQKLIESFGMLASTDLIWVNTSYIWSDIWHVSCIELRIWNQVSYHSSLDKLYSSVEWTVEDTPY